MIRAPEAAGACLACGAPLVRRPGEYPSRFRLRRTCGRACACSLPKKGPDYAVVDRGYVTPCWAWQKTIHPTSGYGRVGRDRTTYMAHRYVYEQLVGPIPEGLHLDHLCRQRDCVNPAHLEPVTQAENNRRSREAVAA